MTTDKGNTITSLDRASFQLQSTITTTGYAFSSAKNETYSICEKLCLLSISMETTTDRGNIIALFDRESFQLQNTFFYIISTIDYVISFAKLEPYPFAFSLSLYIYVYNQPISIVISVHQWSVRPRFNPWSSHTKNSKKSYLMPPW